MIAEAVGYAPTDLQIVCLLAPIAMLALAVPGTWSDIVLSRRRANAVGVVTGIETASAAPATPVIDFPDSAGNVWRFASDLPCNRVTRAVGGRVPIVYDPMMPSRAREAGRPLALVYRWSLWYAVIILLPVLVFWPGFVPW